MHSNQFLADINYKIKMFLILCDEKLLNNNTSKIDIIIIDSNMMKFIKWDL